jgi:hypothetical protein
MKHLKSTFTLFIAMALCLCIVTVASAKDKVLKSTVASVSIQDDRNGNSYGRIIISEPRELNGVTYTADVAVMCFGSTVTGAQSLSEGDAFSAIVSENMYQGRKNYGVIQFLE